MSVSEVLLFLLVLNLGTAFGAGLYETRIILPIWFGNTADGKRSVNFEAMRSIDTGRKFWGMTTTLPLTLLLTANIIAAFNTEEVANNWWVASMVFVSIERVATFIFFIPTAIKIQQGESMPQEIITTLVSRWITLNYLRIVATFAALILALKGLMVI